MAKKWKAAPTTEPADESDEEIDVVGEGRGRSPAPAATAPGPSPRDPEPTLLYNGEHLSYIIALRLNINNIKYISVYHVGV